MTRETNIILIGGYGHVGKLIAEGVKERNRGIVVIAGRDADKARKAAMEIDPKFRWSAFDVDDFGDREKELVESADIVVVCVDQSKLDLVEYCLRRGKIYLDITAKSDFLEQLGGLDALAKENKSLAIVSLGLCPGVTNLVAAKLKSACPDAGSIATGLLLFLGEAHGRASIEWTLDNFIHDFFYSGTLQRSFHTSFSFSFPGFSRVRDAYRFNFSDQHALKRTYDRCDFATYLAFDSALVTHLLHVLKVCRVDRLLRVGWIRSFFVRVLQAFSFGQTGFAGEAVAVADGRRIGGIKFSGGHTGLTTASVLVETITRVNSLKEVYGVKHIHDVLRLEQFLTTCSMKVSVSP